MKRDSISLLLLFLALLCPSVCRAQSLYVYPITAIAPRGSYQSVTAIVTGVNNKTVTWSTSGGTLVGTNPCVVNEPCTIAVHDATAETDTLTATSNASGSVVATSTLTFTASPVPVTTWPRFLITQANLAALQAKATSGNPMYQAIYNIALLWFASDNATTAWGRTGSTGWSCLGGNSQPATSRVNVGEETGAFYYSLLALIDPSDPTYNWGCYAHDTGMYVMTQYPLQSSFPGGANSWSDASYMWALLPDWLRGSGAVTSSGDLTTMHNFGPYLMATVTGTPPAFPSTSATYNSPAMFAPGTPGDIANMRGLGGNNYSISRNLLSMAWGIVFNDNITDDPNFPTGVNNTCGATRYQVCPDGTAGSMRAYWNYADGALLYDSWAHFEDPYIAQQAYNNVYANLPALPTLVTCEGSDLLQHPCFGDSRDGGSAEGEWYKYSFFRWRYAFNLLHSAGMDDPLLYGPQISLGTSSWNDMRLNLDLASLTAPTTVGLSGPGYVGAVVQPRFAYLSVGDTFNYGRTVQDTNFDTALLVSKSFQNGISDRTSDIEWLAYNMAQGGPLGTQYGCGSDCGFLNNLNPAFGGTAMIDLFLALPAANPVGGTLPTDPRPSLPVDITDASFNQQQDLRTNWGTSNSSLVAWWDNNSTDNHEYNIDGRTDVFSCLSAVCEYITKGRNIFNNYNFNMEGARTGQDFIGITNAIGIAAQPQYQWKEMYLNGGQFPQGSAAGFVLSFHSELPTYAAKIADTTNAYNGTPSNGHYNVFTDINSASHSTIWLRGTNQVVQYKRASVVQAADLQTDSILTTGTPTITGSTVSWLTRSATQEAFYTSLLPVSATVTSAPILTSFTISGPFANLQVGTTEQLAGSGSNVEGTNFTGLAGSLYSSYLSDSPGVCTVSATGLITAVALGTCNNVTWLFVGDGPSVPITVISGSSNTSFSSTQSDTYQPPDWEPYAMLRITPPGTPTSSQFLSVLQWGASSFTPAAATLVQSTAGQGFDGSLIGSNLVMFMRAWPATFTSTTFAASGATAVYVSDLTPGTSYAISGAGAPTSAATDTAGVLAFAAGGSGNITVGSGSSGGVSVGGSIVLSGGAIVQ